jgi:hypothetical protein
LLYKLDLPRIAKMTPIELLADSLRGNVDMLKATLADFSDQDMLVRPVPSANHALWQLGHLAVTEAWMLEHLTGNDAVPPPAHWQGKFKKDQAKNDDPEFFPKKGEILAYFDKVRAATADWVRASTPAALEKGTGDAIKAFAPTAGHLILMFPVHAAMHIGQFQVIRRKLGKPVLF